MGGQRGALLPGGGAVSRVHGTHGAAPGCCAAPHQGRRGDCTYSFCAAFSWRDDNFPRTFHDQGFSTSVAIIPINNITLFEK